MLANGSSRPMMSLTMLTCSVCTKVKTKTKEKQISSTYIKCYTECLPFYFALRHSGMYRIQSCRGPVHICYEKLHIHTAAVLYEYLVCNSKARYCLYIYIYKEWFLFESVILFQGLQLTVVSSSSIERTNTQIHTPCTSQGFPRDQIVVSERYPAGSRYHGIPRDEIIRGI